MRILYAAGNRVGSYEQLKRYLPLFKASGHDFLIAGYKKHLQDLNADFCLDALLNFTNPNGSVSFNGNFSFYTKEINKFSPNIILSDFEIYTSIYAIEKNIPLWQISPALLYYALPTSIKKDIRIHKYNSNIISGDRARHQYIKNILNNSERKLVLSHLCDTDRSPTLISEYEWCRPEFQIKYNHSDYAYSNGTGTSLADAFYNEQFTNLKISEIDIETITGISCNIYFNLGQLDIDNKPKQKINININNETKFLMELIK